VILGFRAGIGPNWLTNTSGLVGMCPFPVLFGVSNFVRGFMILFRFNYSFH